MNEPFHLTFLTPCFCAGANQLEAEIRPASLRGALRWWFRCVGGTSQQESEVFGCPAGAGAASALLLRVRNVRRSAQEYSPDYVKLADDGAYLNYFLSASTAERPSRLWETQPEEQGRKKGKARASAFFPQESSFEMEYRWLRVVRKESREVFDRAFDAFLRFGSIGYRKSRGFGAWSCAEKLAGLEESKRAFEALRTHGFSSEWTAVGGNSFLAALNQIERKLRPDKIHNTGLRLLHPAKIKSALGYSLGKNQRQASAVSFRPGSVQNEGGRLTTCLARLSGTRLGPWA